jgi:hypothetical protein
MSTSSDRLLVLAKEAFEFANTDRLQIPSPIRAWLLSLHDRLQSEAKVVRK